MNSLAVETTSQLLFFTNIDNLGTMSGGQNPRGGENRGSAIVIVVVVQGTSYRHLSKTDGKVFSNRRFPRKVEHG